MSRENAKRKQELLEQHRRRVEAMRLRPGFRSDEADADKAERKRRALADPVVFAETYLPEYATSKCNERHRKLAMAVLRNRKIRRVVRWPRAHAKSVWCDLIIPLWLWARGEPMYCVVIGASFDASKVLLSDIQAEFEGNPLLIHDFGEQEMTGHWTDGRFTTKGGFTGHALGMGQHVRGLRRRALRPTYVVMDDCETKDVVKNEKRQWEIVRWVEGALLKTMDGPVQRFLIANNGFAPSMIQRKLLEKHPSWELDEWKAYDKATYEPGWPEKYTADYWRNMEEEDGKLSVWAEFLHEPHVEGSIFTEDLFNYGDPPRIDHFVKLIGHWDVAYAGTKTADFNAVRVWGLDKERRFWLVACFVKQSKMRAAVDWMVEFDRNLPAGTVVHWQYESQFWNGELENTISAACDESNHQLHIRKAELEKANKYDRLLRAHTYYQNGRVWYANRLKGQNDHEVGMAQLRGIEPGYSSHDDAPDADERCFADLDRESRVSRALPSRYGNRERPKRSW